MMIRNSKENMCNDNAHTVLTKQFEINNFIPAVVFPHSLFSFRGAFRNNE
jgi:hypothetical protein